MRATKATGGGPGWICRRSRGEECPPVLISFDEGGGGIACRARRKGLEFSRGIFAIADRRLGDTPWCVGRLSIADIHLFRLFWRFRNALHPPDDAFPRLLAHHDRMMARDAVQRTIGIEAAIGYELP